MTSRSRSLAGLPFAVSRTGPVTGPETWYCPSCGYHGSTTQRLPPTLCPRCKFDRPQWGRNQFRSPDQRSKQPCRDTP